MANLDQSLGWLLYTGFTVYDSHLSIMANLDQSLGWLLYTGFTVYDRC